MKKIFAMALCLTAVGSMSAQKINVDNAKKLSGKFDKIEEARNLIKQAMEDPTTSQDANTYFIAGKIEFDNYDKGLTNGMIKPDDPSADPMAMAQELLNGYKYFMMALPYDSVPNEKGEIKPKFAKNIVNILAGHATDYFTAGSSMYNAGKYYPEAYEGFNIYAELPEAAFMGSKAPKILPADRAQAYFNAGISAYSGNQVKKAAEAFKKARLLGSDDSKAYMYEIACWQNLAQNDTTMQEPAQAAIMEIAEAGYNKFGLAEPIFLNNLVNTYVQEENYAAALDKVNALIAENPENSNLYGLEGFIQDRKGDDEASLAAYQKAVAIADCDFETLKNAAKKFYTMGTHKLNELEPNDTTGKLAVKTGYFDTANDICQRAKALNADDPDLANVLDSIEYALQTYF
ncbi:MAG: hypothetical protein HDR48_04980 [Bacteroides sp.]|nr:hypothetical protein [Bacteroides sp.]